MTTEQTTENLRTALIHVAYECDPHDPEWANPIHARHYLWGVVVEALGGEDVVRKEIEAMNV